MKQGEVSGIEWKVVKLRAELDGLRATLLRWECLQSPLLPQLRDQIKTLETKLSELETNGNA